MLKANHCFVYCDLLLNDKKESNGLQVSTISLSSTLFFLSCDFSEEQKQWVRTHGSLSSRPSRSYQIASKLISLISSPSKLLLRRHPWTLPRLSQPIVPVFRNFLSRCTNLFFRSQEKSTGLVAKEELGRATWTFLHTLAAQYPEKPTRQQKKDVKELMAILSRMYPCRECADHFKEILRSNPAQTGSQEEFSQWLCHVHNTVNRSLGKLVFPCERVDARWGKLECEQKSCDLHGTSMDF